MLGSRKNEIWGIIRSIQTFELKLIPTRRNITLKTRKEKSNKEISTDEEDESNSGEDMVSLSKKFSIQKIHWDAKEIFFKQKENK